MRTALLMIASFVLGGLLFNSDLRTLAHANVDFAYSCSADLQWTREQCHRRIDQLMDERRW